MKEDTVKKLFQLLIRTTDALVEMRRVLELDEHDWPGLPDLIDDANAVLREAMSENLR